MCALCILCFSSVGLARTIHVRCIYGFFGSEFTINTVIYGVYIRFWPILLKWPLSLSVEHGAWLQWLPAIAFPLVTKMHTTPVVLTCVSHCEEWVAACDCFSTRYKGAHNTCVPHLCLSLWVVLAQTTKLVWFIILWCKRVCACVCVRACKLAHAHHCNVWFLL